MEEDFQEEPWGTVLKELMLCIFKWTLKIIVALFIIWFSLLWFFGHYFVESNQRDGYAIKHMMESLIGISYSGQPEYRDNHNQIKKLTKQEWLDLKCKKSFGKIEERGKVISDGSKRRNISDKEILEHEKCTAIHVFSNVQEGKVFSFQQSDDELGSKFGWHPMTSDLISLGIGDYILERPEILPNLIRIAERPCNFITKPDDIKEEDKESKIHQYGTLKKYYARDTKLVIRDVNQYLNCDKSNFLWNRGKKYIEINIMSSNQQNSDIRIFVRRKDI